MVTHRKVPELDELVGCRIYTHRGSGGVVTDYGGPFNGYINAGHPPQNYYTIRYRDDQDSIGVLNGVVITNGEVLYEGKPLQVLGLIDVVQVGMF